ncbi:uncharacterized protein LOC127093990 [Lathyrus oleraceus]|uniref:uncharacterized protein LOC127093990 n=1 Tax=Pisum sativum TaxID=3888 RepID=UPI0021CF1928|nr:uncharacterized protein LOC127093990 [Pisum sativum]
MTSPRSHEETSSVGDTTMSHAADVGSSMALTVSETFVGPILTLCQPQMSTPTTMGTSGQYMPSFTVSMHKTLGMPTEFIANFILQTELPRGWKVLKFTKFVGDIEESTVEHVARYQTEAGDIKNNEDLKLKYFPSSLTKNAFTWFTTLPPQSIQTWTQLERLFHEKFYMGQSKISLKKLASVKWKVVESVDQYLNRFRLLKARCFTQVPEHELVEIAVGGLDYSIRKKLDTQYLRDMAQLADRVRCIERLKAEKSKTGRYHKKEKISYITVEGCSSDDEDIIERSEVNMAELKPGPPYVCKVLNNSNGKNPIEAEKIDKYVAKTYTFNMSKCDEIFDLLVKDGQIIVPQGLKDLP